ncbi:MAG: hypothetical protein Q4B04_04910, partial [bacterium]|nr:hypothetical protein [bacterium]
MIVPMKKVSLIIMGDKKQGALKKLRKLGIIHIEITEGSGEKLGELRERIALLESAIFTIGKAKNAEQKDIKPIDALSVAAEIATLDEEKKQCQAEKIALNCELDRLKSWGEVDPNSISSLASKGYELLFYEMPESEYEALPDGIKTVRMGTNKSSVKFMLLKSNTVDEEKIISSLSGYRFTLPQMSTEKMEQKISELSARIDQIDAQTASYVCYADSIKRAIKTTTKEIEFETYATGMEDENLSPDNSQGVLVSYFKGYIETENLDRLKQTAVNNSWGLIVEEPCEADNVPTKLKNNKFVSLIYPLTDFLGTVPGYFEYDISGWFLAFILIFFGI